MFGLGWQELLIILVIGVLVIGPEQLPQLARTIGRLMAQFRRASNDLRDTINREFTEHEEFKDFKEFGRSLDSEVRGIGYTAQEYVEREVAHEEAELRKLEREVNETGGDPGPLTDPAPADPTEEPISVTGTAAVAVDTPAAEGAGPAPEAPEPATPEDAEEPPTERTRTRKETA